MAKEPVENTSEFDIGDYVSGKKFANFEHDFSGIIEKIYEHSVMILITDYDPEDTATVNEYNQRAVVRMSDAKILKKTDNPAPRPSEQKEDEEDEEVPEGILNEEEKDDDEEES